MKYESPNRRLQMYRTLAYISQAPDRLSASLVKGALRLLTVLVALAPAFIMSAQEPAFISADSTSSIVSVINSGGNITVVQPAALDALVRRSATSAEAETVKDNSRAEIKAGYRVQVFDDNNPRTAAAQAKARERQIAAAFPHLRVYTSFNSPYWRVKVGDFRTRGEAEAVMTEIREAFPYIGAYLRIVRDRINIFD